MTSLAPTPSKFVTVKFLAIAVLVLFGLGATAKADQVSIVGNSTGSLSTATVTCSFNAMTNTFTFTLTNTSPFDARVTGIGFDLVNSDFSGNGSSGVNGFAGGNVAGFTFADSALGNVPQFGSAVLDFGWTTGNSGHFNGGSPNNGLAPGNSLVFSVSGASFAGMTESQICNAVYVRFQRVGANGEGSDVGRAVVQPVPEPATMLMLGTGLMGLAAAVRRRRSSKSS